MAEAEFAQVLESVRADKNIEQLLAEAFAKVKETEAKVKETEARVKETEIMLTMGAVSEGESGSSNRSAEMIEKRQDDPSLDSAYLSFLEAKFGRSKSCIERIKAKFFRSG
jgi:hypothetical protein